MVQGGYTMRRKGFMVLGLVVSMSLSLSLLSYAAQSERWIGSGDRWQVSDNRGVTLRTVGLKMMLPIIGIC